MPTDKEPASDIEVAKAIRDGKLSSPQRIGNRWLFNLRVTGTGISHRTGLGENEDEEEFVYRNPKYFLTDAFLEQCAGIPLVFEHPEKTAFLSTEEFRDRSIGTVILPYIRDDEVWAIGNVYDEDAVALMGETHISTSPGMSFDDAQLITTKTGNGEVLRIEGSPSSVDHLAVVPNGVWDKGGDPVGIDNGDGPMTVKDAEEQARKDAEEAKRKEEEESDDKARADAGETEEERKERKDRARKDAEEEEKRRADKARKDGGDAGNSEETPAWAADMAKRMDALHKRLDSIEDKGGVADGKRKDDETAAEREKREAEGGKKANEELEGERREKERKDAEEKGREEAERKDKERKDSIAARADRSRIAALEAQIASMTHEPDANDVVEIAKAQGRADSLARALNIDGMEVRPIPGEGQIAYRKRLAAKFQKYARSDAAKGANVRGADASVLPLLEQVIYADAQAVAADPSFSPAGGQIYYEERDMLGRKVQIPHGDSAAFIARHSNAGMRLVGGFHQPK